MKNKDLEKIDPFYLIGLIPKLSEMLNLLKEVLKIEYRDEDSLIDLQLKIKLFLNEK
mgnify:FL=1